MYDKQLRFLRSHIYHTAMTTPEETATPAAVEPSTDSNLFLSADDAHDKAIHLVLDTSPFLRGGVLKLRTLADKFYTIPEVLNEIRDRQARNDLALLPFDIQVINPTEASVRAGNSHNVYRPRKVSLCSMRAYPVRGRRSLVHDP